MLNMIFVKENNATLEYCGIYDMNIDQFDMIFHKKYSFICQTQSYQVFLSTTAEPMQLN